MPANKILCRDIGEEGLFCFLCSMKNRIYLHICIALMGAILMTACAQDQPAQQETAAVYPKGKLFIIGGGDRGDSLMQEMLDASGWKPGDLITTITLPSGWGDSAYIWLNTDFKRLTGQNCVKFDSAAIGVPEKLDSLRRSKVIFISGGDQNKMMKMIAGTEIKKIIQEAYQQGAMISGTSAGASIMSEHMLTGDGRIDTVYSGTYAVLWRGNLDLVEGLGLLDSVIIDQHFVARSRYNRLLSAIIEHPDMQCVGIDEGTAILVSNGQATVYGESQVLTFDKPRSIPQTTDTLFTARGIEISIYGPGESFAIHQ